MAVDEQYIQKLEKDTDLLRKLSDEVGKAIVRAEEKIEKLRGGASREEVFPRTK
jgi:hypothetical protein